MAATTTTKEVIMAYIGPVALVGWLLFLTFVNVKK